mmetsp:Transcript_18844/g.29448  ORF Transcript_18844/g.29448 Transcript_18844/m.29448 type:complete len:179 (-) Transcript_18844:51-587(-)|eukprot:CAMPEP_0184289158 /NCGR_PEP_ID=MMETSP1049-20130417/1601_1 /TAXON_ID=77928 /ORGANISM="Proteomonas sulcata, Strain CCMP704" /LENGTH=178 /DNA_ID=CAMNT_0026595829 /DNA_START=270 /DNA_END=806 /DNA_ORIENTATION=-
MSRGFLVAVGLVVVGLALVSAGPPLRDEGLKGENSGVSIVSQLAQAKLKAEGIKAVDDKKLKELKLHHVHGAISLQGNETEAASGDSAADGDDDKSTGPAVAEGDDDDTDDDDDDDGSDSKKDFWKGIIGGQESGMGMMGGGEKHKPSKDVPTLIYVLPIVGFIGVILACVAYFSFGM